MTSFAVTFTTWPVQQFSVGRWREMTVVLEQLLVIGFLNRGRHFGTSLICFAGHGRNSPHRVKTRSSKGGQARRKKKKESAARANTDEMKEMGTRSQPTTR